MMKHVFTLLVVLLFVPAFAFADTLSVSTDKASYLRGDTMKITAVYKTAAGAPITSPTTREIRIESPSGSTLVKNSMAKAGNGVYTYSYSVPGSASYGTYTVRGRFVYRGVETKAYAYPAVGAADATPPSTSITPAPGSYLASQNVALSVNEPAVTYYTTDGSTPVYPASGSTRTYSAPISIAATTTLKYFSRDAAGNSEAVKSALYTIAPPSTGKTHDPNNTSLVWNGYGTCQTCHKTEALDMYQSVHYQWQGSGARMTTGPASQGKMDALDGSSALNAYCINIIGGWKACGSCHVGTGAKPVVTATPSDAQLSSIDCLMCHNGANYARTRNAVTGLFEPSAGIDMNLVLRSVVKPSRNSCLGCHAKAGGGDAVKRGDLALASGTSADLAYDVHMATSGGNLTCQSCHAVSAHRIAGRGSDLRPLDSTAAVTCSTASCHAGKTSLTGGHSSGDVSHHVGRVACQTCHLPLYARNANDTAATEATEIDRNWEGAEWNSMLMRYEPLITKANDLTPRYAFWNGTSWGNNLNDAAEIDPATGNYRISRPVGAINDAASKLYPFKYKTSRQPIDIVTGKLVGLNTATFFATGNYTQAVLDGLAGMGRSGDAWQTVTTDEYQVLNHQIPPASGNALSCSACHPNATATRMKLASNYGYGAKKPLSDLCNDCHDLKSYYNYKDFHDKHVASEHFDCGRCHNFSRQAERGLR